MTTVNAVAAVLDANRLSELLQRPARAARLRIKPEVSVLASLTDRSTGLTTGWARPLWPVSHSKAAQVGRLAAFLGLQLPVTRSLDEGLLLQYSEVFTDPKLAEPPAQAMELGVLGSREARDVLRYNPLQRLAPRDGSTVLRLRTNGGGPADEVQRTLSRFLSVPGLLDSQAVAQCEGRFNVQQWCEDTNLAGVYADDSDWVASAQGLKEGIRYVGVLLVELYSCAGQLPADLIDRLPYQPAGSRELTEVHVRLLDILAPELACRIRVLGDMLPSYLLGTSVLTYGDVSLGQVLYRYLTGWIWLTDFDRTCLASAATGLGSHLVEAPSCQRYALLEGYIVHRLISNDEEPGWVIALSRLARLVNPLRRAHLSWRERISADLVAIKRIARPPEKEAGWVWRTRRAQHQGLR